MHYQISRNGQIYGPYTIEDLERYLGTGNVLGSDLAKSDEMPEWVPVSQILATHRLAGEAMAEPPVMASSTPGGPYAQPVYAAGSYNPALASSPYEDAPNLQWGLVVLFSVLTCGFLFSFIWDVVIAAWLKRVQPTDRSLFWYLCALGVIVVRWICSFALFGFAYRHEGSGGFGAGAGFWVLQALSYLGSLITLGLVITANFVKRASLLEHFNGPEPVGLELSPVMTFFFAPWYFQYHLNHINAIKKAARDAAPHA